MLSASGSSSHAVVEFENVLDPPYTLGMLATASIVSQVNSLERDQYVALVIIWNLVCGYCTDLVLILQTSNLLLPSTKHNSNLGAS